MAIMAPYTSFTADLAAYLHSRVLVRRVLWLVLLVSAAALASDGPVAASGLATVPLLTALLVAQLRLWDDLADRRWDSRHHPGRLLSGTVHVRSFAGLLVASTVVLAALLALRGPWRSPLAYLLLTGLLATVYHAPFAAALPRSLRVSLVLTKYPLLLLVVMQGALAPRATWLALGLYGLLVGFEWRDDPVLRRGGMLPVAAAAWSLGAALVLTVFLVQ